MCTRDVSGKIDHIVKYGMQLCAFDTCSSDYRNRIILRIAGKPGFQMRTKIEVEDNEKILSYKVDQK